jgi:hypothetical protein
MFTFGNVPLELRECLRKDGAQKKSFRSRDEAEQHIIKAGWQRRYHAYECSQGLWHVGRKYDA